LNSDTQDNNLYSLENNSLQIEKEEDCNFIVVPKLKD